MDADLFEAALRTGGLGTWETDLVEDTRTWTRSAIEIFGINAVPDVPVPFSARDHLRDVMHPDDRSLLDDAHVALETKDEIEVAYRFRHHEKGLRYVAGRGRVVGRTAAGGPSRVVHIVADVTERREIEARNLMLMRELTHRTKNQLAVVLGIARRIGRDVDTIEAFNAAFTRRLEGLVSSIDALVEPMWQTVSIRSLIATHLRGFVGTDSPRLSVRGDDLALESGAGEALGMALHELAANAQQHGALSNDRGRIEIAWRINGADGERLVFHFEWAEHDGPAVPREGKPGFGSRILTTMTESALNAEATFEMRHHGIYWGVTAPIVTPGGGDPSNVGIVLGPSPT
jgi:two-component sensor histidine kinase